MDSENTVAALGCTGNRHCLLGAEHRGGSDEDYPSTCSIYHISFSHVCTVISQYIDYNLCVCISNLCCICMLNFILLSVKLIYFSL